VPGRHNPEAARITGSWVKRERKARGWTQGELTWRARLTGSDVTKYEHGTAVPTLPKLWRIAEAFHGSPFASVPEFNDYLRDVLDAIAALGYAVPPTRPERGTFGYL
jgi:transcriptional regulator with XRE-family HTH domain